MSGVWISPDILQRLAGSLLHFVWQGGALAVLTAVALRLMARRSAESRYALAVATLVAMLAAPVVTFVFYAEMGSMTRRLVEFMNGAAVRGAPAAEVAAWTHWILLGWSLGATACITRLMGAWMVSRNLIRSATFAVPAELLEILDQVQKKLEFHKPIRLLIGQRVGIPVVIGWLKPVVLLPLSTLTGLDENQLRAVLAHEVAHIRRHDFLVNTLQRCVGSALFYHPAVWWLSARIRAEREHCCDDLAVAAYGDRVAYAQALILLEQTRSDQSALALSVGGVLIDRVRRILGVRVPGRDWQPAALALLLMVSLLAAGLLQTPAQAASSQPVTAPLQAGSAAAAQSPAPASGIEAAIAAIATGQGVPPAPAAPVQGAVSAPVRLARVSGRVIGNGTWHPPSGKPGSVWLIKGADWKGPLYWSKGSLRMESAQSFTNPAPDGSFELPNAPSGAYTLALLYGFGDSGYLVSTVSNADFEFALTVPSSAALADAPGAIVVGAEDVTGITITLSRPIAVRVSVQDNGPVPPFTLEIANAQGDTIHVPVSTKTPSSPHLLDGEYRVSASGLPAGFTAKSILYGTTDVLNAPLIVGNERREMVVTIGVADPTPWTRVRGHVIGPGRPDATNIGLILAGPATAPPPIRVPIQPDGAFEFPRVVPGVYEVRFDPEPAGANRFSVTIPSASLFNMDLDTPARATVSGRVAIEKGVAQPPNVRMTFSADTPASSVGAVQRLPKRSGFNVAADGSFSTVLPEGQYQIEVSVGLPYVVRAVSDGSSDLPGGTLQFSQRNGGGPPVRLPTQPDGPLLKIVNGDTKNLLVTLTIPTFAIRGRLRTFETSGARMVLTGSRLTEPLVAAVGPDGAFEFPKVPAGGYSLGSTAPGVGRRLVVSDRDVLDTEFVELTGRMIASGGEPPPNLAFSFAGNAELLVSPFTNAEPCPGGCGRGGTSQLTGRIAAVQVIPEIRAADGSFRIVAPEGEYRVTVTGFQSSHSLKSFRFGDVDLLTNPLRVSLNGSRELRLEFGAK